MSRWIARIAFLVMALALAGCDPPKTGDVKVVQKEQQTDGERLARHPAAPEVTTYDHDVWERVALVRDRKLVGLTALSRASRIACDSPQSCRVQVLSPGSLWAKSYELEPQRFSLSDTEHADLNEIARGLSVPIPTRCDAAGSRRLQTRRFRRRWRGGVDRGPR